MQRRLTRITASNASTGADMLVRSTPKSVHMIFVHQLRPFPHPADLMEPASHGFGGHLDPVFGLERRREGGTTPPRAAPAIAPWGFFEYEHPASVCARA